MKSKKSLNFPIDKFINFSLYSKKLGYYMKKNPFASMSMDLKCYASLDSLFLILSKWFEITPQINNRKFEEQIA